MKKNTLLEENFIPLEKTKRGNWIIFATIIGTLAIITFIKLYFKLFYIHKSIKMNLKDFIFVVFIFCLLHLFITLFHEWLHKITAVYFNKKANIIMSMKKLREIKQKRKDRGLYFGFCTFEVNEKFNKKEFIYIAATPLIIISILHLVVLFLVNDLFLYILFSLSYIFKVSECESDLNLICSVNKSHKQEPIILIFSENYEFKIKKS